MNLRVSSLKYKEANWILQEVNMKNEKAYMRHDGANRIISSTYWKCLGEIVGIAKSILFAAETIYFASEKIGFQTQHSSKRRIKSAKRKGNLENPCIKCEKPLVKQHNKSAGGG
jgi:hypothetical protein